MIIAQTLDKKRVSYDGRVYIDIADLERAESRIAKLEAAIERWGDAEHYHGIAKNGFGDSLKTCLELADAEQCLRDALNELYTPSTVSTPEPEASEAQAHLAAGDFLTQEEG